LPSESQSVDPTIVAPVEPGSPAVADPSLASQRRFGYRWLWAVTALLLVRSFVDILLVRRPRLGENLAVGGMVLLISSLFGYLLVVLMTHEPDPEAREGARVASSLVAGDKNAAASKGADPATVLFMIPPAAVRQGFADPSTPIDRDGQDPYRDDIVRSALLLCHLAILAALVLVGWWHYQSPTTGLAMALLYLLMPATLMHALKLDHLVPSTLVLWAFVFYRNPIVSGSLMGLACVAFFPLFLVPVWVSFYRRRGVKRFLVCIVLMTAALWLLVYFVPALLSFGELWTSSISSKVMVAPHAQVAVDGFWTESTQVFRLPIAIVFGILVLASAFVPREKTLADLIALCVAILLALQFWWADRGGIHIHWYLPMLILMMFRPNLSEAASRRPLPNPVTAPASGVLVG
jgi:hypothetical protein